MAGKNQLPGEKGKDETFTREPPQAVRQNRSGLKAARPGQCAHAAVGCWKSDTGEEMWKERLGGDCFASPVMLDDRIYASNVNGRTFVFEATPGHFKLIAQNQIGDEAYASPVICGGRIYLRVAKRGESRQEFLYCVGR